MGDMLGHSSWVMPWLAASRGCVMRRVGPYLPTYIHNHIPTHLVTILVFHPFISVLEGGLYTNSYMS